MKNFLKSYNVFTLAFAVYVILTVIWTPIYGVGDLSEYTSTFESVGLYNANADTYSIAQNYGVTEPDATSKSFFELFLMSLIKFSSFVLGIFGAPVNIFNIHFLSVIYSALFLLALYFLQKNIQFKTNYLNYVFSALLAIVFLDKGYVSYLNSFYTDAIILVLTLVISSLAVSISKEISVPKLIGLGLCTCTLSALRFSMAVIALVIAVVLGLISFMNKGKIRSASLVVAAVVAGVSIFSMFNAYIPARDVKLFSIIYNDFAVSDNEALDKFGVSRIADTSNVSIDDMKATVKDVTYKDVVKYYFDNPQYFGDNVKSAINNSYFLVHNASYMESGANYGIRSFLPIKIWNFLKKTVLPKGVAVVFAIIAVYAAIAGFEYSKHRKNKDNKKACLALFAMVLPVAAISELIGTVITTGKILISKNMIGFGIYFDLMLITAVLWCAVTLIERNKSIKEKYGVNQ